MTAPIGGVAWTPGPWVIDTTENPHIDGAHWRQVRAGEHGPVLGEVFHDLGDPDPGLSDADAEANARLIAAAPELYEGGDETNALVEAMQANVAAYLEPGPYTDREGVVWSDGDPEPLVSDLIYMLDGPEQRQAQGKLRAALAKARGEQ